MGGPLMKRAFSYVRVSSAGQSAEDRDGIPRQKEAIRKYAATNGIRIVRWFEDSVSGKKDLDNRPALPPSIYSGITRASLRMGSCARCSDG
jgi:Resolvase, N terminal domain